MPDTFNCRPDGTVYIEFDTTKITLGQIRNRQLQKLKAELDQINDSIRAISDADTAAMEEIEAYNQEHAAEEGFEPKQHDPTTVVLLDYFAPWIRSVVSELGQGKAELPKDEGDWPTWLTAMSTINNLITQWQFTPLARGGA